MVDRLAHDLGKVGLGSGYGANAVVVHQHLQHARAHERRKRGAQVDALDAQVQQREQDAHRLLLVPREHHGKRQVVHAAAEGIRKRESNLDRAVGVVALADVQQARNAADGAQVQVVEAILAAGKGQDDRVGGGELGEVGVVAALLAHAVAARKQDETLDVAGLDRIDGGGRRRSSRCRSRIRW